MTILGFPGLIQKNPGQISAIFSEMLPLGSSLPLSRRQIISMKTQQQS